MPQRIDVPGHGVVEFPDGMSESQIVKAIQANSAPASIQAGSALNDIGRQLGLTARYALEGPAQASEVVTEPIRQYITDPLVNAFHKPSVTDLVTGRKQLQGKTTGQMATDLADWIGLPKPQGANERVVADATRLGFGAGGLGIAGRAISSAPGLIGQAGNFLASNPASQITSAAGAGAASGASREAGGSPLQQAVAGVVGGIAAPTALNGVVDAGKAVKNFAMNRLAPEVVNRQVDNTISLTLRRQGIDWGDIDASTRAAVRNDVKQSITDGKDLNGDALRRLIDYRRVGATPTLGGLTLDPVQITREKNLAKMGANSSDTSLQQLAQVENQNNGAFIRNLNESGAANARDPHATGENLISALGGYGDRQQQNIGQLYGAARDSAGRSAELDGHAFTQRANQLLQENLAGKLPAQIEGVLNDIASGKAPLTVDHAEQIKTALARIQRSSSDGNERYAMGLIRRALEDTPLKQAAPVNPGNLPATLGGVPLPGLGQDAIDAFSQARAANRQFMGQRESIPALDAAMNGAQPDNFLRQFVTGSGGDAAVNNVRGMRDVLQGARINPENLPATAAQIRALPPSQGAQALTDVKNAIADHLKRQALNGAADEVGNFSQSAYNKAMRDIGDRKLALFFSPDEISQLKAVGRVASYSQFQPRGSAVNNSNSGALMLGKGLDFLASLGSKIPLGLNDTITGKINGVQASRALTPSRGLLSPEAGPSFSDVVGRDLIYGGLLAAPQIAPQR